jgi:hypothetical protein
MGLIKTAMMSGAAMYGVKQITKTAQARHDNPSPPRREYPDDRADPYYSRPAVEYRDQRYPDNRAREYQDREQNPGYQANYEPRQVMYSDDGYPQPQYMQAQNERRPQYESARYMQSSSAPPSYSYDPNQYRQRGYVEPEPVMDDPRNSPRGGRADMMNMLAQQAMSMGMLGGKDGGKDGGKKNDLIQSFLGK